MSICQFKLTDIPQVMQHIGWNQARRLMLRWFNSPPYELPMEYKLGKKSASSLPQEHVLSDLPFAWLRTSSARVAPRIDELVRQLTTVVEDDDFVGRDAGAWFDQLTNGLLQILRRLDHLGAIDHSAKSFLPKSFDFSARSAVQLDANSQFNFITIGSSVGERTTDELDDVYGALGQFLIKVAFTRASTYVDSMGFSVLQIDEIGLYARDTYEFHGDNLLGYWSNEGVVKPSLTNIDGHKPFEDRNGIRYWRVMDSDFNEYRRIYKRGRDFMVFSTVERHPVYIAIHLRPVDFMEYEARKGQ